MAMREQIDQKIYENEINSLHREIDAVMAEKDELEDVKAELDATQEVLDAKKAEAERENCTHKG